jgi:glutathionyl-hydroquinone reductase
MAEDSGEFHREGNPVLGIEYLGEAYRLADPDCDGGITVPAIVDVPSGAVVTNDYPQITLGLSTPWREHHRDGALDLYSEALRNEVNDAVFRDVNNGCTGRGSRQVSRPTSGRTTSCSPGSTCSRSGCGPAATCSETPSPRRTFGCG